MLILLHFQRSLLCTRVWTFVLLAVLLFRASISDEAKIKSTFLATVEDPSPPVWAEQFHAVLFQKRGEELALVDLWYDFPNGRNLNIIQNQLGSTLFDNERQNGSTYYYYGKDSDSCKVIDMGVGLLRPNWLSESKYHGEENIDGFSCYKWTHGEGEDNKPFVTYWNDIQTGRPVKWVFFTGAVFEVMKYQENVTLPDEDWQIPPVCFIGNGKQQEDQQDIFPLIPGTYFHRIQLKNHKEEGEERRAVKKEIIRRRRSF
ncbi:unnamed protein product [Heterosigma akashiwo]